MTDSNGQVIKIIATGIDVTQRHEAEMRLERLAHNDTLTGLPNRRLFMELLNQALLHARRNRGRVSVMFMDLDHFKAVNDEMGHDAGDALLVEVAKRVRESLRDNDVVARLGGDEFTVILSDNGPTKSNVELIGKNIIEVLKQPFYINNKKCLIGSSIGISRFPEDGENSKILLKHADTAMYAVKNSGRNQLLFYSEEMEVTCN